MTVAAVNQNVRVAEAADGGLVILGAWCSKCREEIGPTREGTCPWCQSQIVDEETLPARALVAQAKAGLAANGNGGRMTATAVKPLCKMDGCENESLDAAGLYGRLCAGHKEQARVQRRQAPTPTPARVSRSGGASLVLQARDLVSLASRLEKARGKLSALPSSIDISSRTLDVVRLDEDADRATWQHFELLGADNVGRVRHVRRVFASLVWDDCFLAAVEFPESRFRSSLRAQLPVLGAVLAVIPTRVEAWAVTPAEWKRPLGMGGNDKPTADQFSSFDVAGWAQDGLDALGVALYARNTNAAAVDRALEAS